MESHHARRPLASNGISQVEACPCGMIYLAIGPVTVKLSPDALEQVTRSLNQARQALLAGKPPAAVLPMGPRAIP